MRRIGAVLLWSAISAAFIGPGTVTTAASAGAIAGPHLLWALVFSTVACLSLQEASARLTALSGLDLGQAMQRRFGRFIPGAVVVTVILGCAAYEAGNILGAVSGIRLAVDLPQWLGTLVTGGLALAILWSGKPRRTAKLIGLFVSVMGLAFCACAVTLRPDWAALLQGSLLPNIPQNTNTLVLALVGTTVVPYNLFLGSGLARSQKLSDIRLGLGIAIPLGGIVSAAILVTGTAMDGSFEFSRLAATLGQKLGSWAPWLFAVGLFAAGLSSAVTAPMTAAIASQSLGPQAARPQKSFLSRWVCLSVALVGIGFGLSDVKPIPVIILAQALNGVLLPLVAIYLWIASNDRKLLGENANGVAANLIMGFSCMVALLLGIASLLRAAAGLMNRPEPGQAWLLAVALSAATLLAVPIMRQIRKGRNNPSMEKDNPF